jgi:hypothetical protein
MPQDSTSRPEPGGLISPESVVALREAIRLHLAGSSPNNYLGDALHRLSGEAHAKGIRAEQLIILLKQVWGEMPEVTRALEPYERQQVLARLVTHCINQYYADT